MKIRKPEMFQLAENGGKRELWLQILIFMGVFMVATIVGNIPAMAILFKDIAVAMSNGVGLDNLESVTNVSIESRPVLYASLFGTILSTIVVLLSSLFIDKRSVRSIGFKGKHGFRDYLIGMIIGFVMFSSVVGINILAGAMTIENIMTTFTSASLIGIIICFIGFLFQGAYEEIIIRGYLMVNIGAKHKTTTALLISSLMFAIIHGVNPGITILSLVNLVLIAVFFGLYIICFDNIWGACAIHSIWNFVQGNFYGIKVSGMNIFDTIFVSTSIPGRELINGGAFGAEGGLATTIVATLAIVILLVYMKKKKLIENSMIDNNSTV